MSNPNARRRIFIDAPVQGALVLRTFLYWSACLLTQGATVLFLAIVWGSTDDFYAQLRQLWWHIELTAIASLFVLPLIVIDVVRLSHRWVGPVFRLRKALEALAKGEQVSAIQFRDGDYWQDMANDFNVIAERLRSLEAARESTGGRKADTEVVAR